MGDDERDWAAAGYARLYQSVRSDPKFAPLRKDRRLMGAYSLLLLEADSTYPQPPSTPAWLTRAERDGLVRAGLLEILGDQFRLSGLTKERESRRSHDGLPGRLTNAEKQKAYRDRQKAAAVADSTVTVTEAVTEAVTVTSRAPAGGVSRARARGNGNYDLENASASPAPAPAGDDADLDRARSWLTAREAWLETPRMEAELAKLVDRKGADAVIAAMAAVPNAETAAQFIFGARNLIYPLSGSVSAPTMTATERADAAARATLDRLKEVH